MAYWLYCQACRRWSKSACSLSEAGSCPHCNNAFNSIKRQHKSFLNAKAPETKDLPKRAPTDEAIKVSEKNQELPRPAPHAILDEPEKLEMADARESMESSAALKTPDIQDASEIPATHMGDSPEMAENTETLEITDTVGASDAPDKLSVDTQMEANADVPELSETVEASDAPAALDKVGEWENPEMGETPETLDIIDMEASEAPEIMDVSEEKDINDTLPSEELAAISDTLEINDDSETAETIEEQDFPEIAQVEETYEVQEATVTTEISEMAKINEEVKVLDSPETVSMSGFRDSSKKNRSKPKMTRTHETYIEMKRRMKKLRQEK